MCIRDSLTTIQFRMLNRSKGAAMWSPRAQCDKSRFSAQWRHTLENLSLIHIFSIIHIRRISDRHKAADRRDRPSPLYKKSL